MSTAEVDTSVHRCQTVSMTPFPLPLYTFLGIIMSFFFGGSLSESQRNKKPCIGASILRKFGHVEVYESIAMKIKAI